MAAQRRLVTLAIVALLVGGCGATGPAASDPIPPPTVAAAASPEPTPGLAPDVAQGMLDLARVAYGAPGALALIRHGEQRTFLASGTADTRGTPITGETRFRIASITKPIVAALVLDAVGRGELGLDDVVDDLVPGVLRPEPPVTIRQLLDHTSGIFDESNAIATMDALEADIANLADPDLRMEAEETLAQVRAGAKTIASDRLLIGLSETHDRLFPPGSAFSYSNTNYQVAALVLARVTGSSLADLLRTRLAEPLGLARMSIAPPDVASPELRGYGRAPTGDALADLTDDLAAFGNGGNGGIIATADDLLTAMQAIVGGEYLPGDLTGTMLTPSTGSYALGIGGYPFSCGTFHGHQGAVNGTESIAVASRDGRDGVVIAFNLRDGADPDLVTLAQDLLCSDR